VTSAEIVKLIKAKRGDFLASLSSLLTYERGISVRLLYIGHVMVRQVPVIIITDTSFPREMHCDEQLGRRFVYVHLERQVDWQRSARQGLEGWRAQRPEHANAANAILSHVIEEFFGPGTPLVFEDIARELGFPLLKQGGDMGLDPRDDLLALFNACCSKEAAPAPASTWKGRGWRLVRREAGDPVSLTWQAVCDNLGDGFATSRRVKEADWSRLLGTTEAVECDISPNGGSSLAIRFRCGDPRSKNGRFNEEIRRGPPPAEPLLPEPPPDGPPTPLPEPPPAWSPTSPPEQPPCPFLEGSAYPQPLRTETIVDVAGVAGPRPVFIDLETRSASDLEEDGGRRYADHPTTQILTVAALLDGRMLVWTPTLEEPLPTEDLWPKNMGTPLPIDTFAGQALPTPLEAAIAAARPLCAHNAFGFDMRVWEVKGLPKPSAWLDTLPEARAAGLPGKLDELGQRLFGIGKDKEGLALIRQLCRPNKRGEFLPFNRHNALKVVRYNIADVVLLAKVYGVVQGHAEPEVLALDRAVNDRGVAFDADLARALIELEAREGKAICQEMEHLTAGAVKASDLRRTEHLKRWFGSKGVKLPDLQKAMIQRLLAEQPNLEPAVKGVLQARLAVNRVTAGKLESALAACGPDGRLRDLLIYHKAHTGRWTGRGVQPHNLPRPHPALKDLGPLLDAAHDPDHFRKALPAGVGLADALSALVRPCFRAAPGKVLAIADFAGVEARGVAWCAREQSLLELFNRGGDPYCELASKLFGRPVTKEMKRERGVGKEAVLGCGYSMGWRRFAEGCKAKGVDLEAAGVTAEAVVEGYRDAYSAIAGSRAEQGSRGRQGGLWNDVEAAAWSVVSMGLTCWAGQCEFSRQGDALVIRLPSGRRLFYRNARSECRVPGYCDALGLSPVAKPTLVYDEADEQGVTTYGGKLVENIVQAICRDLLVAGLLECERQGLPVVLHVHDEVVVEVPAEQADEALRRLVTVMSTPPNWASGFPVEVEGFIAERYGKSPPKGGVVLKGRNGLVLE